MLHLTPTEYRLLEAFVTRPGKLLTHRWLLQRAWGSVIRRSISTSACSSASSGPSSRTTPRVPGSSSPRPASATMEAGPPSVLRSPYRDLVPIIEIRRLPPDRGLDVSTALVEVTGAVAAYLGEEPRGTWAIPGAPWSRAVRGKRGRSLHAASRNASRDRRRVRRRPRRPPAPPWSGGPSSRPSASTRATWSSASPKPSPVVCTGATERWAPRVS